ncbi:MAG TPA: M23 family metallopeptidase [Solirubrobacterales bacterium]|nr:M23 family metallopeptidase [Solirubrobacterales bacterium]
MPRRLLSIGLLALLVAAFVPAASAVAAPAREELTPVVGNAIASPEPVLASNGRQELAYELQLINRTESTVTVKSLEALAGGKVVQKLSGAALEAQMAPYGQPKHSIKLKAGQGAYVLMDVSLARKAKVPAELTHRIKLTMQPKQAAVATDYELAPIKVTDREAVVVAPPLRGPGWVVANGCCNAFTAHRGTVLPVNGAPHVAERFAIDFVQLDPLGRLFEGPLDQLSSYPYFGDEVHSATAGKVVGVVDDIPNTPAGAFPPAITAEKAGGNHVVVSFGGGHYAFYAHLQPGTVTVKVGQKVKVGQVLGLLGNSGNSNAPHLHFHVMDSPHPLASNGMPYRFSSFTVEGELTNLAGLETGETARVAKVELGARRDELPLNDQVIAFPEG